MFIDHVDPVNVVNSVDGTDPDVVDPLLWRDAQQMLGRHAAEDHDGRCVWCGWQWPCPPRRLAERAEVAACRPWQESWTARHDMNGLRTLPAWRTDGANRPYYPNGSSYHPNGSGAAFD